MKRRDFIKKSTVGLSLPFWLQGCDMIFGDSSFPVFVRSDEAVGHLVRQSDQWPSGSPLQTEIAIAGGGLAGLAAAYRVRNRDFLLFELSDRLGGTSSSHEHQGVTFAQGAHYELAYPDGYGEEVLQLFEELGVIQYEKWKSLWTFKDRQHVIPYARRQQCYENGRMRSDVIPDGVVKDLFYHLLKTYEGQMKLPTRLIGHDLRYLNDITFYDFLSENMEIDQPLKRQLSYHMLDDYGGDVEQVSALAGIHYFMCRPYLHQDVDLFSPPNGNSYFAQKMTQALPEGKIKTSHLVKHIRKEGNGYALEILDVAGKKRILVQCDKVIYAGQKHALKYICPEESPLFANSYAPWMVLNFITDGSPDTYGYWQNEYLGERTDFLGFIDSSVQSREGMRGKRVLSAYYCLKPADRAYLSTVADHKQQIANETLEIIQEVLKKKIKVEAAFIHVMGHAMPIPGPGYLFNDASGHSKAGIVYAGVDNGRLPLLYEALDSGILAAEKV